MRNYTCGKLNSSSSVRSPVQAGGEGILGFDAAERDAAQLKSCGLVRCQKGRRCLFLSDNICGLVENTARTSNLFIARMFCDNKIKWFVVVRFSQELLYCTQIALKHALRTV